jgi:SecD-like export protein
MKKSHIIFIFVFSLALTLCAQQNPEAKTKPVKVEFKLVTDASNPNNLILGDKVLIDNNDIADAHVINRGSIALRMTPEGARKFKSITEQNVGKRIAILLDNKIISAPTLNEPITTGSVKIILSEQITKKQTSNLVAKILNKPVSANNRTSSLSNTQDSAPPKYYTDEEYLKIKKQREELGLYSLDRNYSEKELNNLLKKGMNKEAVIKLFGKPSHRLKYDNGTTSHFSYTVAPERQPIKEEIHDDGFSVIFEDDKVWSWSLSYSNRTRRIKPQYKEESKLKITLPKVDFTAKDIDCGNLFNSISVPDTTQKLNKRDGIGLIRIVININGMGFYKKPPVKIKDDSDLILLLESNFTEVAQWKSKNKKSGKKDLLLKQLNEILVPYFTGKKKLASWN